MKLLIDLFGECEANEMCFHLEVEVPNMDEDYYIRNVIRMNLK